MNDIMYKVVSGTDVLLKIKLENIADLLEFIWKMSELYSVNVAITEIVADCIFIVCYDEKMNYKIDISNIVTQRDYDSLKYPLM